MRLYIGKRLYTSAGWQIGFGTAKAVSQRLTFAREEWPSIWAIQATDKPQHAMNQGHSHIGCGEHVSFVDSERGIYVVLAGDLCHREVNYSFFSVMKQPPTGLIKKKPKTRNLTKLKVSFPLWSFINICKISQLDAFSAGREVYKKKGKKATGTNRRHYLLLTVTTIILQPRPFKIWHTIHLIFKIPAAGSGQSLCSCKGKP